LQADTQTTVTMLCLAGLHVRQKKIITKYKNVDIIKKKHLKTWQK